MTMEVPHKTKPLPSLRLALARETHHNGKTVRVLEITPKSLSPIFTREISQNGQYLNTKIPVPTNNLKPSPSSNASSLASWVDEFCQGTGWNRDESMSVHR